MENENEDDLSLTLQKHRVDIVRSIDTERQFIICYLQSKLALDIDDCERISSCTTRQDRAAKLLDILLLKGPDALAHFIAALEIDYPKLYERITGKKADSQSIPSPCISDKVWDWTTGIDGKTLIDFDRQYLAKQLDRAVADMRNMTYFQTKVVEEKNTLERMLYEAADDLQTKERCMEDLKEEIMHLISDKQAAETEKSCRDSQTPMHNYLQELWRENLEKSRAMIALQGKVILANEQIESLKKTITEITSKNDGFKQQIRELTILNKYERTNSMKLSKSASEQADELKRELKGLKFQHNIMCEEKDSLQQELDSFQKWTEVLNVRFDALKQEKAILQDSSENLSNRFLRLQNNIEELQVKQTWQNFKTERSEHEVNRLKSAFETARVDRDRILQSLQEVRLARDEANKENYQLRSNLKDLQVKYESDIERQRILFDELWNKHEDILEELKLMEERACDAEKSALLAEQALDRKEKKEDVNLGQHVASKPDDTPKDVHQPPSETKLEIEDGPKESSTSLQEPAGYFMSHKRNRDSLIDSIRRKLLPGNNEEVLKVGTLPTNFGRSMKMSDYEHIMLMNPSVMCSQSLPLAFRRKKDAPGYKRTEKQILEHSGGGTLPKQLTDYVKNSKSLEPFRRDRCYCIAKEKIIGKMRSQSVPPDIQLRPMQLQPKED